MRLRSVMPPVWRFDFACKEQKHVNQLRPQSAMRPPARGMDVMSAKSAAREPPILGKNGMPATHGGTRLPIAAYDAKKLQPSAYEFTGREITSHGGRIPAAWDHATRRCHVTLLAELACAYWARDHGQSHGDQLGYADKKRSVQEHDGYRNSPAYGAL